MAKKVKAKKQAKKASKKVVKKSAPKAKRQEVAISVNVSNLPAVITEQQIAEPIHENKTYAIAKTWVSSKQIMRMVQRTPAEHVYQRPGKGGQKFSYVTGNYVEKVLNYVFGFLWDFEVVNHGVAGDFIWVQGKLTVKNAQGSSITKTQFGRAEIKYLKDKTRIPANYVDYGNDLKAATTDALKKCASLLGIASDIYGKQEYKQEAGKTVQEEQPKVVVQQTQYVKEEGGAPESNVCFVGDEFISESEAAYSQKIYGKKLCRDHQKEAKKL